MRRSVATVLLTIAVSGCAVETSDGPGSSVSEDGATSEGEASSDVVVESCQRGDFGLITSTLAITNSSDSPKSYLVTVSADGPDGARVAELNAAANSVQPGQAARVDATGSVSGEAPEGLTCTVVSVNRF